MVLEGLNLPGLGAQMGGSALVGGIIGFAAKKVAKIIAVIVGAELVLLKFLESRGVLQVNWGRLVNASEGAANSGSAVTQSLLQTFLSTAGIGASFAGGFLLGFKRA
jgi:uncharacterized membrane protein (Fun14 family)